MIDHCLFVGLIFTSASSGSEDVSDVNQTSTTESVSFLRVHMGLEAALGATFAEGGEKLLTLLYEDNKESELHAHEGARAMIGPTFILGLGTSHEFELQALAGIKYVRSGDEDSYVELVRWPIDTLIFYRWLIFGNQYRLRFGGGLQTILGGHFSGEGMFSGIDMTYEPSFAGIAQLEMMAGFASVGLRYTAGEMRRKHFDDGIGYSGFEVIISFNFPYLLGSD